MPATARASSAQTARLNDVAKLLYEHIPFEIETL